MPSDQRTPIPSSQSRPLPRECARDDGRPKLRYETRAEAKAAVKAHGDVGKLYRCGHCGYFHLATKADAAASERTNATADTRDADIPSIGSVRPECTPRNP